MTFIKGIALIKQEIQRRLELNMRCGITLWYIYLAEALLTLDKHEEALHQMHEAFDFVELLDERFYEADLYRLKGQILMALGRTTEEVEPLLLQGIQIARQQRAVFFELKNTLWLARLYHSVQRSQEGRQMLLRVYDQFPEKSELLVLKEARELLEGM